MTLIYLFPKLKEYSRKRKFSNDNDVICRAGTERPRITVFYDGIRALEKRWYTWAPVTRDHIENKKWQKWLYTNVWDDPRGQSRDENEKKLIV